VMDKFKAVRCGSNKPTPYLRKHVDLLTECAPDNGHVVDIGCGEGRNSRFLMDMGMGVMSLDGKGDFGIKWMADQIIPTESGSADCILCNYFLMFLPEHARNDVYNEMTRIAHKGTRLMIELENVKQSLACTKEKLAALNVEVIESLQDLGWKLIQGKKDHLIFARAAKWVANK